LRFFGDLIAMSYAPPPGSTLPNYRTTRMLGVVSIGFASCLLIFGICLCGWMMVQPLFLNAMKQAQTTIEEKGEAARKATLEDLSKRAEVAKTDEEKAQIAAERKEVENRPKATLPGMLDISKIMN